MPWFCATCGEVAEAPGGCPRCAGALAPASALDMVGHPIGDYTAVGRLGGGGFASVYHAIHRRSLAQVAIKLLRAPFGTSDAARAIVEARAAAAIQHPNVVRVYEVGVDAHGRPFLVMELVVGAPFGAAWPRPAPVATVLGAADGMLAGVEAAHRLGIVHRDLKPDNVLVTTERGAVVLDFGVAKLVEDPSSPALTATGERLGTPRYMAPEQITGAAIDARADVYALGAMLYEALAGEPPFPGDAVFALYQAHLNETPAPLAARGVPAAVAAVVERALAKEPARRHADAGALRRALATAATKRPRRRARVAIMAAVAVAAIVGVGVAARLTEPAPAEPAAPPDIASTGYVVPPADVPLDPNLERTLAMTARYLGQMPRTSRVQSLCAIEQALRSPYLDAKLRSFYTRYVLLLHEAMPGEDPAKLCPQR